MTPTDAELDARIATLAAAGDVLARPAGRLRAENAGLRAEVDRLRALVLAQADRVHAQGELLSRKAEAGQ